ncbi:hypothetical protein ABW20_dc0107875 [Dactylellina cionopaga]|nr:hypothetical protein ABW20_dc0107875 [Dactylellina cionopaga]
MKVSVITSIAATLALALAAPTGIKNTKTNGITEPVTINTGGGNDSVTVTTPTGSDTVGVNTNGGSNTVGVNTNGGTDNISVTSPSGSNTVGVNTNTGTNTGTDTVIIGTTGTNTVTKTGTHTVDIDADTDTDFDADTDVGAGSHPLDFAGIFGGGAGGGFDLDSIMSSLNISGGKGKGKGRGKGRGKGPAGKSREIFLLFSKAFDILSEKACDFALNEAARFAEFFVLVPAQSLQELFDAWDALAVSGFEDVTDEEFEKAKASYGFSKFSIFGGKKATFEGVHAGEFKTATTYLRCRQLAETNPEDFVDNEHGFPFTKPWKGGKSHGTITAA